MRRLVVVDSSEWVVHKLRSLFKNTYEVYGTSDPLQVMALLETVKPEVLVLDLVLLGGDSMEYLRYARLCGFCNTVIATTPYAHEGLQEELEGLGVACLMMKPFLIPALVARIEEYANKESILDPYIAVNNTYLSMGLRPDLQGYRVAVEGLVYVMEHPNCIITKELYPELAKRLGGTTTQIERACRDCIAKAWASRDISVWSQYFPGSRLEQRKPISNGRFLKQMAACLKNMGSGSV